MSQLDISMDGRLGVIALNRPEAINALSRDMIDGIMATLTAWRADDAVRAVLFEGRGARGFCAGGDVRAVRQLVLDGRAEAADAYFAAEYAMNLTIATYSKPVVAIGHGAVMGGGIGILGHARYRFAAAEARFAMPEAAIGFVTDVGVNAILAMVPEPRALAFLLSGPTVGVGDALVLGLCDAAIEVGRMEAVRAGIAAAAAHSDPDGALVRLMEAESIEPGQAVLCAEADRLAPAFALHTAAEIVAAVEGTGPASAGGKPILGWSGRSPLSLEVNLQSHRAARKGPEIAAVLTLDRALAGYMARQADFPEGVRAVLVDKDQRPAWTAPVDRAAIATVIAAARGGEAPDSLAT